MLPEATDQELLAQIAQRGVAAREAEALMCRRYAPRIRLYGLRHLRDEDRARDLVQVVLMGVLEAARTGRIDDPSKVDRFVLGTCRNAVLRMRERAARLTPVEDDVLSRVPIEPVEAVDTTALLRCFDGLELRAKKVVMLSFQEERSADEIASVLELTAGNVRVLRHRALLALRRCMDGQSSQEAHA